MTPGKFLKVAWRARSTAFAMAYGELHSDGIAAAADFRTLDYLSRWFDIETAKSVRKRNYFFDACRKDLGPAFRDFRRCR